MKKLRAIQTALNETGGAELHRELARRIAAFQGNEARAGGARRDLALARTALGSLILLAGIDMARTGAVTGRAPREPDEREQFLRTKQAYSVRIGDRWYAYNRLDPLGMTLGIADLAATFDAADLDADLEEDALKTVASTVAAFAEEVAGTFAYARAGRGPGCA